jgi:ABC-type enterobactin transport system permease subunit
MFKKLDGSKLATIFGALTTVCTAWAVLDLNTFDIKKDWLKLVIIGMPALGGYMSSLNKPKK